MWAHSANVFGRRHGLAEHAVVVAELAARFGKEFGAARLAYALGLTHDADKAGSCWQRRLLEVEDSGERVNCPHKELGALRLARAAGVAAMAILGHHGGLTSMSCLKELLERGLDADEESWQAFLHDVPEAGEVAQLGPGELVPSAWQRDALTFELGVRLVFSALVDADHLDTAAHRAGWSGAWVRGDAAMDTLAKSFEQQRQQLVAERTPSWIDAIRDEVYAETVRAAVNWKTGIYRLPAPTGAGKTITGAGFGLHHAAVWDKRRVIVAVPFITVTEQNAQVYRNLLGAENVLEHHSSVTLPDGGEQERRWRAAAENWDSPFVVTTTVQLFDSLFSRKPSRMRKLHRLANAVLVLDEVQALPLGVLVPILNALRVLSEQFGTTVLLTSATQPSFELLEAWDGMEVPSVVSDPVDLFQRLRRVRYEWWTRPQPSLVEVADTASTHEQMLMVVNTTADARAVYQRIAARYPDSTWHLSTRMGPAHRRRVLATVRQRLAAGLPVRLVSTSLIEAGVDVSFPRAYRALAPAESLQQAAGRANRDGEADYGTVVIFEAHDMGVLPPHRVSVGATRTHFCPEAGEPVDPDDVEMLSRYYRTLYQRANTDRAEPGRTVQENRAKFDFSAVADGPFDQKGQRDQRLAFRMLADDTVPLVVTTDGSQGETDEPTAASLLEQLRADPTQAGWIMRKLQPFLVNLPHYEFTREVASLCRPVFGDLHEWCGEYDSNYGIDTTNLVSSEVW